MSRESAQKVVELYTGRYLDDYTKSGDRAKTTELLRRCAGMSRRGHFFQSIVTKEYW